MKAARLVVLGIAVAAGGLAALLAGRSGEPPAPPAPVTQIETVDVLVANADIAQGTTVKPDELRWQMWPAASAGPNFIRKSDRPDAIEQISGSIVRGGTFFAGEPIQESRLVKANSAGYLSAILPAGMRAVATEISAETSAGGFVVPGDYVDVILARRDREAEKRNGVETYTSETIITNARVLAVDQTVEDKNGQKVVIGKTVTLELTPRQVETLALGKHVGTLSLALRSVVDTSKSTNDTDDDPASQRSGVNMVRFGVSTTAASK
ncbi:Flp pilus assembly protein CpaB [Pseudorhodoplanes sp.]|uniref:Flp pilus assembly protein CpaB n=1 Tax=Pseudorhodoplanes sp. TaxID=1934341 RepID=UPI003D0A84BE